MDTCDPEWLDAYTGVITTFVSTSQWDNKVSYKSPEKDSKSDTITQRSVPGKKFSVVYLNYLISSLNGHYALCWRVVCF